MPVTCPHCSTRYVLPESLIGPGGARVRCPRCREPFSVGPDGGEIVPDPPAPGAPAPAVAVAEAPVAQAAVAVVPAPDPTDATPDPAPPAATPPVVDPESLPQNVARAVLDDLASHSGDAIAASQAKGHLFREFGAVIAEAYEFYRRRVGPGADPAPFRAALKERWGVDLEPGHPSRRLS